MRLLKIPLFNIAVKRMRELLLYANEKRAGKFLTNYEKNE